MRLGTHDAGHRHTGQEGLQHLARTLPAASERGNEWKLITQVSDVLKNNELNELNEFLLS